MSDNDYIAPIIGKLTVNGAINLRSTVEHPCELNPDAVHGVGQMYTGLGKWTTLAVLGIERHLVKLGLAEMVETGPRQYPNCRITALGREVAAYLHKNWDDLSGKFRAS